MSKSLPQLQKEIAKLQRQAEALKKKEAAGVIARIKEAIDFYGLTAADLGFGARAARKPAARPTAGAAAKPREPGKIKYRDEAGHTWSGHGRRPKWFLDALAAGKSPDDMKA